MRRPSRCRAPFVLLALSLVALPARAQDPRLGRVTMVNSGAPAAQAAQAAFLDGLAALHSFFYDEAADAFRNAEKLDPGFALAYWGEAMTYNHPIWGEVDLAAAQAALAKLAGDAAGRAAKAATEREKLYLAAVEALFAADGKPEGEKKERDLAYSEAMRGLYERFPEDREAAAFYALSLQGLQHHREVLDERLQMRSAAILEEIFAANPLHPGAAHYLIHAYDDPVHAPLGLRAARVYAAIAPAAHHALHMPSHIFVQLGLWDDVVASNRASWAASAAWVARRGHPTSKRDYHSLGWLHYAYLQEGRYREAAAALALAREAAATGSDARAADAAEMMAARQVVESGEGVVVASAHPAAATSEPEAQHCGSPSAAGGAPGASTLFAQGVAALRRGDLTAANDAAAALGHGDDSYDKGTGVVLHRELAGLIQLAGGNAEAGLALLAEAATLEEKLGPPSGPPVPIKPAVELYGEALLAQGKAQEAAAQLEKSLQRTPNRSASLLAAARAAAQLGQEPQARELYTRLAANWRQADAGAVPLAETRLPAPAP